MPYFVHNYPFTPNAYFRAIAADNRLATDPFFVAGGIGTDGLFASTDTSGLLLWQKKYTIKGETIGFRSAVRCDNGDFILYGSRTAVSGQGSTNDRNHNLVVRVDATGKLLWCNTYFQSRTRYNYQLVKGLKDTYFFTSWSNNSGSSDDIEVVRIDGNGKVLSATLIDSRSDDQVYGLVAVNDGVLVYGGTGAESGWGGFMILLDGTLQITWSTVIGNTDFQEIKSVITPDAGRTYYIAGETGAARTSFVARFSPGATTVAATVVELKSGPEWGDKRLLYTGSQLYLLTATYDTTADASLTAFDSNLNPVWEKRLGLPDTHVLLDIAISNANLKSADLLVCGYSDPTGPLVYPLLANTNRTFDSCITQELTMLRPQTVTFNIRNYDFPSKGFIPEVTAWKVDVTTIDPALRQHCPLPTGGLTLGNNPLSQSSYIYLQAAGSTAADQTVAGFHLRWDLLRRLGEQHLPKGNLVTKPAYATSIAYNRPDDFVRIYKMEFKTDFGVQVSFATPPNSLNESGTVRQWIYSGLIPSPGRTSTMLINFTSTVLYDNLRASVNPLTNPQQFIQQYTGRIEASVAGKLAFLVNFILPQSTGTLRAELMSLPDRLDTTTRRVSSRSQHSFARNSRLICENIEHVRFDYNNTYPTGIRMAAYEDYLYATVPSWQLLGQYSLDDGNADANAAVFKALEDTTRFQINQRWPKYNQTGSTGEFTVSVPNYRNRWLQPQEGLKKAVVDYLAYSRTDTQANVILANTNADPNDTSTTEVSYLSMLNFVSLDFHAARMLGLGTIDPLATTQEAKEFVYLMKYVTTAQLENEVPVTVTHYYMTPPATMRVYKLPPAPVQLPLTYGLTGDQCGAASAPTDPFGYVPNVNVRYININRDKFLHELPSEAFFATSQLFTLCDKTLPVMFGLEYAAGPNGTGTYVRPELNHDDAWLDPGGLPEVSAVPDTGNTLVYTHGETQAGIHHYALYSINWFSRVSVTGNEQQTDATVFTAQNTLLPPSNLAVQLIQRENPNLFTTPAEQSLRGLITNADKTMVRVAFDWNYIHHRAYQFGNKAEILFRTQPPKVVRGDIQTGPGSITVDTFSHTVIVQTTSYTIVSTNPIQVVQPNVINAADAQRYVGARCVVNGEPFVVVSILSYGNNPQIRLKQIRQTATMDPNNDNTFCTVENWISPPEGGRFMMVENVDQNSSWDKIITKKVDLIRFLPDHTETVTYPDGQSKTETIGGLFDGATIAPINETNPNINSYFPPGIPSGTLVPTGGYTITFATKQLTQHPDPDVDFYQGLIRVKDVSGAVKELQVLDINTSGATLVLKAVDPTYALVRDAVTGIYAELSGTFVVQPGCTPIQTGVVTFANYHPSYKAYFYVDAPFAQPAILPAFGEGTRQTYIGIRSLDTANSRNSYIATPAVLLALELNDPVAPLVPPGPNFATRPNFYGKATYTFDMQVQQPFALLFFRASERTILDQLYKPDKVQDILADMAAMSAADAAFNTLRWRELANNVTEAGTGLFKAYTPGGFRFPIPNNNKYSIPDPMLTTTVYPFVAGTTPPGSTSAVPNANGATMAEVVKDAIDGAFLPLTETPAVYTQITSNTLQTSGRKPRTNDESGNRMPSTDSRFDPCPMVVKYEKNAGNIVQSGNPNYGASGNQRFVRFTDYTLDGGAVNQYFYFAAEMSNRLELSERSDVIGPIQLVNTRPAETPGIKQVSVQLASTILNTPAGVRFTLNDYLESEGIRKIAIYRATDPDDALAVRTMQFARYVDMPGDVLDNFSDLPFPLYGETLFYRLVAQREIMNEQNLPELVPSQPTDRVMVNLVDNINPLAPELAATFTTVNLPPSLTSVQLSWPATCYNGTYHLYKMTAGGNWEKIHTVTPGAALPVQVLLSATTLGSGTLLKTDSDGNTIYHRFRVQAVNSSGLVNLNERELTL